MNTYSDVPNPNRMDSFEVEAGEIGQVRSTNSVSGSSRKSILAMKPAKPNWMY